jgi:hypothetical protein
MRGMKLRVAIPVEPTNVEVIREVLRGFSEDFEISLERAESRVLSATFESHGMHKRHGRLLLSLEDSLLDDESEAEELREATRRFAKAVVASS